MSTQKDGKNMALDEIAGIIKEEVEALAAAELDSLDRDIFFKDRFLDSMNMLNLIIFLEAKYDVELDTFFLDREAVSSVNKLAEIIQSKLKRKVKH